VYILFVCSGNTCRSVLAKYILLSKIPTTLKKCLMVESAGISVGEVGALASEGAREVLAEWGIDASDHRAQKLTAEMTKDADLTLTMTGEQLSLVEGMLDEEDGKAFLFSEFANNLKEMDLCRGTFTVEGWWGQGQEILDPYGGNIEVYRKVRDKIDSLVKMLVEKVSTKDMD
jgi:protein-tyrosine-phosphatase